MTLQLGSVREGDSAGFTFVWPHVAVLTPVHDHHRAVVELLAADVARMLFVLTSDVHLPCVVLSAAAAAVAAVVSMKTFTTCSRCFK